MRTGRISRRSKQLCATGKRRYRDRDEAKAMIRLLREWRDDGVLAGGDGNIPVRAYFCAECKGWHLTKIEEWIEQRCPHGDNAATCTWYTCMKARGDPTPGVNELAQP